MVRQREKVKELESLIKSNTVLRIGYARTSTLDQNLGLEVQLEALRDCDVVFSEQQSGSKDNASNYNKDNLPLTGDTTTNGLLAGLSMVGLSLVALVKRKRKA